MTKTTRKKLEAAMNHLKKCDGKCIHCKYCDTHCVSNGNNIFFAPFVLMAFWVFILIQYRIVLKK